MIQNRYISILIPLSERKIIEGSQEIDLKYKDILRFNDKLTCFIL